MSYQDYDDDEENPYGYDEPIKPPLSQDNPYEYDEQISEDNPYGYDEPLQTTLQRQNGRRNLLSSETGNPPKGTRRRLSITAAFSKAANKIAPKESSNEEPDLIQPSSCRSKDKFRRRISLAFSGGSTDKPNRRLERMSSTRKFKVDRSDSNETKVVIPKQTRRSSLAFFMKPKNQKPFNDEDPASGKIDGSASTFILCGDDDSQSNADKICRQKSLNEMEQRRIEKVKRRCDGRFEASVTNSMKLYLKKDHRGKPPRVACKDEIKSDYERSLNSYKGGDDVEAHLDASNLILRQFVNITETLGIDGESHFGNSEVEDIKIRTIQLVFREMEGYLLPRLTSLYDEISYMTAENAANIILFYNNFLGAVKENCPYGSTAATWRSDITRLLDHYIDQNLRPDLKRFANAIASSITSEDDSDIKQDPNGQLVSNWPENVTFYLRYELDMSRGHLPSQFIADVFEACTEQLSHMISGCMLQIGANWRTISERRYCCIVNDASRLSRLLGGVHDKYFSDYCAALNICDHGVAAKYDGKYRGLQKHAKRAERELVELAVHATSHLCEKLIYSLHYPEQILNTIGERGWESSKRESAVKRVIGTFHYHFVDIEEWLSSNFFFHKVLKECFDLILQAYVESFYVNTMSAGVRNAARAAKQLSDDYLDLVYFFNGSVFEKHYNASAILSEQDMNSRLLVIQSMSRLVDPSLSPMDLTDDTRTLLHSFSTKGESNTPALLHLTGLRTHLTKEQSMIWLRIIAKAESDLKETSVQYVDKESIKLPDLRNSPYIHRVTLNKKDLTAYVNSNREVSKSIMESSLDLYNIEQPCPVKNESSWSLMRLLKS